jgi:hypothetical protein
MPRQSEEKMTQHQAYAPSTPLSGILSGTGADLIRATVHLRAVPTQPPTELANEVHPSYDTRGQLTDWLFGSPDPHHHAATESFEAYRAWRATFASDRFIGERAFAAALLSWAAGRCDVSALGVLRLPGAAVDFHTALAMNLQAAKAEQFLNASADTGFGLSRQEGPQGAFRAFIPTDPPTVLLEDADGRLSVAPDGLTLRASTLARPLVGITGWRVADDHVLATHPDGEDRVTGSPAAMLRIAGRHAPDVQVRQRPLAILVAPMLVSLRDACTLAGRSRAELHFRSTLT